MAYVVTEKRWSQGIRIHYTAPWTLRLGLWVTFLLVIGFAVVCVGLVALMRLTSQPLFTAYADVFPGQPKIAAEAHGFTCRANIYPNGTEENCTLRLETGIFSDVGIISAEGIIRYTNFIVRDGALRLGDLEAFLGRPGVQQYGSMTHFIWPRARATGMTNAFTGQFSHFLPLWSVSLTDPGADLI